MLFHTFSSDNDMPILRDHDPKWTAISFITWGFALLVAIGMTYVLGSIFVAIADLITGGY